jgi:signal transduction histidine kinase/streptogramin lyase
MQAWNRHVLLFLFTCLTPGFLQAQDQDWKIKHISIEDGLLNRFVNCVAEDNRGFIWVGTNFGLYRYDGYHVEVMTAEQNGLSANTIYSVFPDQNDNLWVEYHNTRLSEISHIDVVNPITFEVQSLKDYLPAGALVGIKIVMVFAGSEQEIYFRSDQDDLYRYDSSGIKKLLHMNFRSVLHDPDQAFIDDAIFFQSGTSDTLLQWTKEGQFVKAIACPSLGKSRDQKVVWNYKCKASDGGRIFEGYIQDRIDYSLFELYPNGIFQKKIDFQVRNLPAVYRDPYRNILWIQTKDDFFNFDPVTGEKLGQSIFQPLTSFSLLVTRDGQIWKGSQDGLYNFKPKPSYFTSFIMPGSDNQSCRGITADAQNTIYVLSYGAKYKYFPKTGKTEIWDFPEDIVGIATTTDRAGNVWCTAEAGDCYKYNPHNNSFQLSHLQYPGFIATWSIRELSTGDMGIGTSQGLWLKHTNDTFPMFQFKGSVADEGLGQTTVMHMVENKEGLWLASSIGLFLVDLQTGVKSFYNNANSGLPYNELLFVHIDSSGTFWLGSRGGGLIKWDKDKNTFQSFTTRNGLSNNVIYAVYEDDFGFLWLTSDFGLMRFEKATGICRTFLTEDGIPHEEFNRASHFKDKEGNFYFGGLNGVVTFNPKNIRESNKINFPLLITKFEVYDEASGNFEDWTNRVMSNEQVVLQPRMKSFIVHYAILDYDDPRLKRYAYKIVGLSDNWNYVSENFVRINGLSGGHYTLHVKGQNTRGEWTENELVIPIRVLSPFLLRPWTMAIMILAFAALVIFLARRRIELHKQKLEREKNISQQLRHVDKLKDQFLANTSHELRTPLNGIVGLSESLLEDAPKGRMQEDLELIISSGRRLSNLVNDILDFSRLKKHDLQLSRRAVNVHGMAELLIRLNKPLLQGKEVTLVNLIPPTLPYCYADENRLQQILQNLIANAIKFTHAGSITLSAHTEGIMNVIAVTDTGIGIEESKQDMIFNAFEQADGTISREYGGSGLGLSITKHLVKLHGGKIRLKSAPELDPPFHSRYRFMMASLKMETIEQNLLLEEAKEALIAPISSNGNNTPTVSHSLAD